MESQQSKLKNASGHEVGKGSGEVVRGGIKSALGNNTV